MMAVQKPNDDPVSEFREALVATSLLPDKVISDGKLRRCGTVSHPKSRNGWYVLHVDPFAGAFGDWATGVSETWSYGGTLSNMDRKRLYETIRQQKAEREAREKAEQTAAIETAHSYLENLVPADNNVPYLLKKGVEPCPGLLVDDDLLVVPVYGHDGRVQSYQRVAQNCSKRFAPGCPVAGGWFAIKGDDGSLLICEGIATGLSIYAATGHTVICAFSAGNLLAVARMARDRYPDRGIVIASDNDSITAERTGHNPGVEKATEAAMAISGLLAIPNQPGDWNDIHAAHGLDAVRAGIEAAQPVTVAASHSSKPNETDWEQLVRFDETNAPPIPKGMIPEPIRPYCVAISELMQVPFDLTVCAALGSLAAASQGKYQVAVKGGYVEPLSIYMVAVLPPGERKSGTLDKCKAPLSKWEKEQALKLAPVIQAAKSERLTREKAIASLRAKAGNPKNNIHEIIRQVQELESSLPDIPIPKRLFVDDVTPEGLVEFMSLQGGCATILEAEGGIFELIAGLYSNGHSNLNAWLKAWSAETITVDRKSKDPIRIDRPALSMVLLPQPDVLRDLGSKDGFRGRGLLGRFLYCLPQSRLGRRQVETQPIPLKDSAAYESMLLKIVETPWATAPDGSHTHHTIRLSNEAYQLWVAFAQSVESELGDGGELHNITDWAGKLPGQAIRIAGLYHVAQSNNPVTESVSAKTMEMALGLAAILTDHAQLAFQQMGADPAVECGKKILKWIADERIELFTARDAFNVVRGDSRFSKMDLVLPGIKELEDRSFIRQVANEKKGPGRKPSSKYEVNPLAHNTHNTQN